MEWNFSKSPVNDSDFRWNWAKANVDPSYKPQGPGIGSLLMSLNPNTQQQGLQQINDDMARDTAARDAVLKQGAAENQIINELYNQDMDMKKLLDSQEKSRNAAQGHKNAAMDLAMRALATTDPGIIKAARFNIEQQFGTEYADEIMGLAQSNLEESKKQEDNLFKLTSSLPELYLKDKDKNAAKANAYAMYRDGVINAKGYETLLKTITAIPSQEDRNRQAKSQGSANYGWEINKGKKEKKRKQDESNEASSDLGGI